MQFFELFFFHLAWGGHHNVFGWAVFGESYNFSYVGFVFKQHQQAVDPWGKTAVRRRAVFKSQENGAKFGIHRFFVDALKFRGFLHYFGLVVNNHPEGIDKAVGISDELVDA